jgi:hypothetical protein
VLAAIVASCMLAVQTLQPVLGTHSKKVVCLQGIRVVEVETCRQMPGSLLPVWPSTCLRLGLAACSGAQW